MKKIFYILIIAIVSSCAKLDQNTDTQDTDTNQNIGIAFTASMPSSALSKVLIDSSGELWQPRWEESDVLYQWIVDEGKSCTINYLSDDALTASFTGASEGSSHFFYYPQDLKYDNDYLALDYSSQSFDISASRENASLQTFIATNSQVEINDMGTSEDVALTNFSSIVELNFTVDGLDADLPYFFIKELSVTGLTSLEFYDLNQQQLSLMRSEQGSINLSVENIGNLQNNATYSVLFTCGETEFKAGEELEVFLQLSNGEDESYNLYYILYCNSDVTLKKGEYNSLSASFSLDDIQTSRTLEVETPGTLSTLITSGYERDLQQITVTGSINSDDIDFLASLARDYSLESIDLSGATIVSSQSDSSQSEDLSGGVIADSAFKDCTVLKSIVLCSGISEIGDYAFYGCSNLTQITLLDTTPPALGTDAIPASFMVDTYYIVIPSDARDAYAASEDWFGYFLVTADELGQLT